MATLASIPDNSPPSSPKDETKAEIVILKERAMKCKVIALFHLNKDVMSNPTYMKEADKKKVLNIMKEWFEKKPETIDEAFNEIILEDTFDSKADYTGYKISSGLTPIEPIPVGDEESNSQTLVKTEKDVYPFPSQYIDPEGRSDYSPFTTNECFTALYNPNKEKFEEVFDVAGNKIPIKVKN